MYNYLARNGQLLAFGLGILLTAVFLISVFSGIDEFSTLAEENRGTTNIFNIGLYATVGLVIIGVLAMLVFSVLNVAADFKGSIKGIAGLVVILIVFMIGRSMGSDDTPIMAAIEEFKVTEGQSATITGAIVTGVALAAVAAIVFIVSEIRNFFK